MNSKDIQKVINKELENIDILSETELESLRVKLLGRDGLISAQMKELRKMSNDDKKLFGQLINVLKEEIVEKINKQSQKIKEVKIFDKLKKEEIDVTIPGRNFSPGGLHIISKTIDDIISFFIGNGFKIVDGPEVELDYYCFEQVNIGKEHVARDMQDTFYFDVDKVLRTHTSSNQVREMEANKDKNKQLAIVSPGKVYRRDTDDVTHSHQFTQIEGMLIGKNITLGNLKAVLQSFIKYFYGEDREIRMRTSYFPFTEPSVEVDVNCGICSSKGCSACKDEGWIEILGAGMIHRNVLRNGGYDPDKVSGFAFGVGVERVAMLKYNIKDIRHLYNNELEVFDTFKGDAV